jgi:predicted nucleic acid-binding protein
MSLVLDNSATIAWAYVEEGTAAISDVFLSISKDGAWVPALWRLEVANVLQSGIRKKRHDAVFRDTVLTNLASMNIQIDPATDHHAWHSTLTLADLHNLTLYDAAYLELALRRNLPLASLDRDLRIAATAEGIQLLGE